MNCNYVKSIYDILKNKNLIDESYILFNIYIIFLKNEKNIIDKINKMKEFGLKKITNKEYYKYESLVNSIISPEKRLQLDSLTKTFLTGAIYLIETNLYELKKYLLPEEYDLIYELNQDFYKKYF